MRPSQQFWHGLAIKKQIFGLIIFALTVSLYTIEINIMQKYFLSVNWEGPSSFFFLFSFIMLILNRISQQRPIADIIVMMIFASSIFFLPAELSLGSTLLCFSLSLIYLQLFKNKIAGFVILTPLTKHLIVYVQSMNGWHFVAFSFILLSLGTWFNLRKSKGNAPTSGTIKTRI